VAALLHAGTGEVPKIFRGDNAAIGVQSRAPGYKNIILAVDNTYLPDKLLDNL
jgi:hypothetical protein